MNWKVIYHPDVTGDLESLGRAEAARVMRVIDERIRQGGPDKIGKPLHGSLAGYRRLRTGHIRIVYRVNMDMIEVIVVAPTSSPSMKRRRPSTTSVSPS